MTSWTKEELKAVREKYSLAPTRKVSEFLKTKTIGQIDYRAKKLGLKKDHYYKKDQSVFDTITTKGCFWGGYLAAKGCIQIWKGQKNIRIGLMCAYKNSASLHQLKDFLGYTGPITDYSCKQGCCSRLHISGVDNIVKNLYSRFNITQRKSLTLEPPNLRERKHIAAFILGYQHRIPPKKDNGTLTFCGPYDFLQWIEDSVCKMSKKIKRKNIYKVGNNYRIQWFADEAKLVKNTLIEFAGDEVSEYMNVKI